TRPSVLEIVAIDRRDHDVLQPEPRDRPCNPSRFPGVDGERAAMTHGAEAAVTRAGVTEKHEGRRPVAPALPDVRAVGLRDHRVESEALHGGPRLDVVRSARCAHLEPRWMTPDHRSSKGRAPGRSNGLQAAYPNRRMNLASTTSLTWWSSAGLP